MLRDLFIAEPAGVISMSHSLQPNTWFQVSAEILFGSLEDLLLAHILAVDLLR